MVNNSIMNRRLSLLRERERCRISCPPNSWFRVLASHRRPREKAGESATEHGEENVEYYIKERMSKMDSVLD